MLNNSNKTLKKMVISSLILTLTYSNFVLVGSNLCKGLISYALDDSQTINSIENNIDIKEEADDEVVCEVYVDSKDIHKTKMEETTEFTENLNLKLKNVSNILVEDLENNFYDNEEQITENSKLKYTKTTINKEQLKNLLGEEGTFEVLDNEKNTLAKLSLEYIKELEEMANNLEKDRITTQINAPQTFNKIVEVENENGELVEEEQEEVRSHVNILEDKIEITYELEVNSVKFKLDNIKTENSVNTSNAESEDKNIEEQNEFGEINFVIENTKSIFDVIDLENLNYLKENKTYAFNKEDYEKNSEDNNEETLTNEEEQAQETNIENIIKFKDTITRASLEVDNGTWTLGEANQVNYRIVLDTTENKAELYKNPKFVLVLPENVESIDVENSRFTVENDNGVFTGKQVEPITFLEKKCIFIRLEGEQTSTSIQNGNTVINLFLKLNIKNNEEQTQETKLYYQNGTVTAYESGAGFDTDELNISFVQPIVEDKPLLRMSTQNNEQPVVQNSQNSTNYLQGYARTNNNENIVRVGEEFEYLVYIYNYGDALQNAIIEDIIPNGLEYVEAKLYAYNIEDDDYTTQKNIEGALQYDKTTKMLNVNLNKLENSTTLLKLKVKANELEQNEYRKTINNEIKLLKNEEIIETESIEIEVSDTFLDISITDTNEKARIEDSIIYKMTIKNLGLFASEEKTIKINIPEELTPGTISIYDDEESGANLILPMNGNSDEITVISNAEDTTIVKFTALYETAVEKNKVVTAVATIDGENYEWSTKLLRVGNYGEDVEADDDENNPENPSNPSNPSNPIDPTNPENPTDPVNPNDPTNPENPNNPDNPTNPINPDDPTNPENPDDPSNPTNPDNPIDPTNPETQNDPEKQNDSNNQENLDKENTEKPEFDLSLTQSLKKVTVTTAEGTTTYDYKDTNFAKVEIHSKYMNGSTVTFEYEITVKNEGTIAGYARKIADYLPKGVQFNSELNKEWYVGEDGNIYSVALIDKLLQPEDTATLKLILTKQMTNDNTGTITNIAEIYEATNEANVKDINSTPADKKEGQNDMAKVEVLVAVKTGTIIIYITLVITVLTILGYGIIRVKKITLKKEGK